MKNLRSLAIFLIVAAAFGAVVWKGAHGLTGKDDDDAPKVTESKSAPEEKKGREVGLKMEEETQKRIGLAAAPLKEMTLKPELASYGRVIDPSPLVALDAELSTAETALDASTAAGARDKALFQAGENVARKQLETSEAQLRTDRTRVLGLRRRLTLEWGEPISQLDAAGRQKLIDRLARFESAFVRVDVAAAQTIPDLPKAARILAIGRPTQPQTADAISPATQVNPKTQAQAFLLRIDHPTFPLRPGTAVTAFLELAGESEQGVFIPREAVVYFMGAAWIYVKVGDEKFERRGIEAGRPVQGGVFVTRGSEANSGSAERPPESRGSGLEDLKVGGLIVISGAQTLLSEEQKSAGGGRDAD